MSSGKRITTDMVAGNLGFCVKWETDSICAAVTAYRVVLFDETADKHYFLRNSWQTEDDVVENPSKAEEYLCGIVKNDGQAEFSLGTPSFKGPNDFKMHLALLKYIFIRAFILMGCEPPEPWGGKAMPEMKSDGETNSE